MEKNMGALVKKGLQNIYDAINKLGKKGVMFTEENGIDHNEGRIEEVILELSELPEKKISDDKSLITEVKNQDKNNESVYEACDEEVMIYCNEDTLIVNFLLEEELFCMKALQNLRMQEKLKIVYEAYDSNGRKIHGMISLHKINSNDEFDVLRILNEIERLKEYGKDCRLFDASWYKYFVKNFLKEDELYYRRSLQNLGVEDKFKILDEAYDMHGRRCLEKMALHRTSLDNTFSIYKIDDEVKRLKKYGMYSRLIDEDAQRYVVANFSEDEEILYRRALQNLGVQSEFEIVDDAYDMNGRRLQGMISLHKVNPDNDFNIRDIYEEIDKIVNDIAC